MNIISRFARNLPIGNANRTIRLLPFSSVRRCFYNPVELGRRMHQQVTLNPAQTRSSYLKYYAAFGGVFGFLSWRGKEEGEVEKISWADDKELSPQVIASQLERGAVLDLRGVPKEELEGIENWLDGHHHPFLRVVWDEQVGEAKAKIEGLVEENNKRWQFRPKPFTCANFAKLAYKNEAELRKKDALPIGWEVLGAKDLSNVDGYFGVAFVNREMGQVIIAHRGTHSMIKDLQTDVLGVVKGVIEGQQESALSFTKEVLQEALRHDYKLGFVGHSLGGWLAQLTTYWCRTQGIQGSYAVTLDTPGVKGMLESYLEGRTFFPMSDDIRLGVDATNYLSLPNIVNCCNEHGGDLFHIIPEISGKNSSWKTWATMKGLKWWQPAAEYILQTHSSDNQLAAFNPESGMPYRNRIYSVITWPNIGKMRKYYTDFFRICRENRGFLPNTQKMSSLDRYVVEQVGEYSLKEVNWHRMHISHFSKLSRNWLASIAKLSEAQLDAIEGKIAVEKGVLTEKLRFQIDNDEVVSENLEGWEFRNQVEFLLKKYPLLHLYATDLNSELDIDEISLLLNSQEREMIEFCEGVIPTRLFLFAAAKKGEIDVHKEKIASLKIDLEKRVNLKQKIPQTSPWNIEITKQISRIEIMMAISEVFVQYKSRNFIDAENSADKVLRLLDRYQENCGSQLPRFKAALYSIKAKINRCNWRDETDLVACEKNYLRALDENEGLPKVAALWSNYGALLNNWAEWHAWEGRVDEAIQMHERALENHKIAHELALEGEWLYQNVSYEDFPPAFIRRDYARGLFLLCEAKFNSGKIDREEYQQGLKEALMFFAPDEKGDMPATTLLFKGIVHSALEENSQAQVCYAEGLRKVPNHATLLNRLAQYHYAEGQINTALEKAEKAQEVFEARGIRTPEDRYRYESVKKKITFYKNVLST